MTNRLDLWGRRSRPHADATPAANETTRLPRPMFRSNRRQKSPDVSEQNVEVPKAELSSNEQDDNTVPLDGTERADAPIDPLEVDMRRKPYRRVAEHKARRRAMSISVSEEEERILRKHAASMDRSFSEWSRSVMFRAIGRKVPSRGRNVDGT